MKEYRVYETSNGYNLEITNNKNFINLFIKTVEKLNVAIDILTLNSFQYIEEEE